jgi:Flp pilus assembly protein TadG
VQPTNWLKKLLRSDKGNAMVVCAATLPMLIGAAAIGVDTIQVSLAKRQLQRSADSAAIAGAYATIQDESESVVVAAVNYDLELNNDFTLATTDIDPNPATGPFAGNPRAVRVALTANRAVPFASLFWNETMPVSVEATASAIFAGQYCAISLEETNTTGISIGGNATVNLGCGMITNSPSANAVSAGGSSSITASPMAAVGGVPASANYASGTVRLPFSPPQEDPYADLPTPVVPASCPNQRLQVQTNDPALTVANLPLTAANGYMGDNVWCWSGIDIKGTVTFPPGATIYVNGGDLDFGAQAVVNGSGVTFILTSENAATNASQIAQLRINGGATLNLSAPDSGTYAGLLMYQDRRADFGSSHINGNSSSAFRGGFYFPNRELVFNGTAGMQTSCIQLVGRRLSFTGNASITNSCPSGSGSQAFDAIYVRLVG